MSADTLARAPHAAAAARAPTLRVAVFDRRPIVADGFGALLAAPDEVEIVAVCYTARDVARAVARIPVDVIVAGIVPDDAEVARRILARLGPRAAAERPRLVGVVSGDQDVADLLGGSSITTVSSRVRPETLREVVLCPFPGRIWTLSPQLVRPPAAPLATGSATRADLLTERERDVLAGIEGGLSTKEIATRLGITTNTVRTHAQRLMSKLDVHSRLQAAAYAAEDLRPRPGGG